MPSVNLGRVSPIPKGQWNSSTTYEKLDVVTNGGSSYIANQNVPIGTSLSTTEYWTKLVGGLTIGTVETVSYENGASANIVTTSTNDQILNLEIPQGINGNETIDDTKGEGDTDYVWSADKNYKEFKNVKNELNKKLDAKTENKNGNVITFEAQNEHQIANININIDPVQDLHGQSSPYPAGGGKNLINAPDITLSGAGYFYDGALVLPAGTYTMSLNGIVSASFAIKDGDGNTLVGSSHNFPYTFTLSTASATAKFYANAAATITNIQIEAGSSATSYAPYSNICPISGWTECNVSRSGKNILQPTLPSWTLAATYSGGEAGSIGTITTATNARLYSIPCKPNTTYYASSDTTGAGWTYILLSTKMPEIGDTVYNVGSMVNRAWMSINTGNYKYIIVCAVSEDRYTQLISEEHGQLEIGAVQTSYETPVGVTTIPISWQTEAGTVYGGTLNVKTGVLTVTHTYALLNDATKWGNSSGSVATYEYDNNFSDRAFGSRYLTACSYMQTGNYNFANFLGWLNSNSSRKIGITNPTSDITLDTIKADATAEKIAIVYEIATPLTYQLTAQQMNTLLGTNNIWADTGESEVTLYTSVGDFAYINDAPSDNKQYVRKNADWEEVVIEAVEWGNVSGNIVDQTDLQGVLDAKVDTNDLGDMAYIDDAPSDGKEYTRKNNTWTEIEDSSWGTITGNLSDQTDLHLALNNKADAIISSTSGAVASFSDGGDGMPVTALTVGIEPVQDLHGQDAPYPAGAYNLINENEWNWTSEYSGLSSSFSNDTWTVVNSNETSNRTGYLPDITLPAGTYYVSLESINQSSVSVRTQDDVTTLATLNNTTKSASFTLEAETIVHLRSSFIKNSTTTITGLMLSTQNISYKPYSNICPISGWDEAVVTRTGVNLWNPTDWIKGVIMAANNKIAINNDWGLVYIPCKPNTIYTLQKVLSARFIVAYTKDLPASNVQAYNKVTFNDNTTATYTTGADAKYLIASVWASSYDTLTFEQIAATIQIELGETASTYQPYSGTSVTIDLDGTRYGGTLDVTTGTLTVTHTILEVYDTDNIKYASTSNGFLFYIENKASNVDSSLSQICSCLVRAENASASALYPRENRFTIYNNGIVYFKFSFEDDTVDKAKAKITALKNANTPLIMTYGLATPLTVQLTPAQMTTLLGQNNVWADTGTVDISYVLNQMAEWGSIFGDIADQNDLKDVIDNKADVIHCSTSGGIVTFSDGAPAPVAALTVGIEPQQDLNGYDHPWPAGGGANVWDEQWESGIWNQSGEKADGNNSIRSQNYISVNPSTSYYIYFPKTTYVSGLIIRAYDSNKTFLRTKLSTDPGVYSTNDDEYFWTICSYANNTITTYNNDISINYPSTVTTYQPYANICPITGWTEANVYRTDTNLIFGGTEGEWSEWITPTYNVNNWTYLLPDLKVYLPSPLEVGSSFHNTIEIEFDGYSATSGQTPFLSLQGGTTPSGMRNPALTIFSNIYLPSSTDRVTYKYASDYNNTPANQAGTTKANLGFRVNYWASGRFRFRNARCEYVGKVTEESENYGHILPISWQTKAGTVYGGSLNVGTGVLTVDRGMVDLGTLTWTKTNENTFWATPSNYLAGGVLKCSQYKYTGSSVSILTDKSIANFSPVSNRVIIMDSAYYTSTKEQFKTAMSGVQLVYYLAEPITYTLTPQQLTTLLGDNNIWADTGDVSVFYRADTKKYIDNAVAQSMRNTRKMIAGEEKEMKATQNYTIGEYLWIGDDLYKVTANISNSSNITIGTNVQKCTIGEQLKLALS